MLTQLRRDLRTYSVPGKAANHAWFFKTGKGEYGEGDKFLGVAVPSCRKVAKEYKELPLPELTKLLQSKWHEERLTALFILIHQYDKADKKEQEKLYQFYLKNTKYVNNWDLVDSSAHKIVGKHLYDKDRKILYKLVRSKSLWERRIAVIATFWFISKGEFEDSLKISEILLDDKHDLIHKAVGWMLREVGNRNQAVEEKFLKQHYKRMPRIMLRYAIEKFEEKKRKGYLRG
jgi:3-methyladenine DNA glycosylase AlkD